MHENINSTTNLFKLFNDSEGVFYTLNPEGQITLRNLKAEDKDFSVMDLDSILMFCIRAMVYERFICGNNTKHL